MHALMVCIQRCKLQLDDEDLKLCFMQGCRFVVLCEIDEMEANQDEGECPYIFGRFNRDTIELINTSMETSAVLQRSQGDRRPTPGNSGKTKRQKQEEGQGRQGQGQGQARH